MMVFFLLLEIVRAWEYDADGLTVRLFPAVDNHGWAASSLH